MSLTEEQKRLRREGIGSSEIAAVVDMSPWLTRLDLFRLKTEPGFEMPQNELLEIGHAMEPGLLSLYAARSGLRVMPGDTVRDHNNPLVIATPDAFVPGKEGRVVEIKWAPWSDRSQWGEPGTDAVPYNYLLQTQWEMAATGYAVADLAVLLGSEFRIYTIRRDADLIGMLVKAAEKFWREHVETKTPPPLTGDESTARYLATKYPTHSEEMRPATPEALALLEEIRAASAVTSAGSERLKLAKNRLREMIGEAAGIEGVATWKRCRDSAKTDWEGVARTLAAMIAEEGGREPKDILGKKDLERFTSRKAGHRALRINGGSNGDE